MDFRDLFHAASRAAEDLARCNRQIAAMRERVSSPRAARLDSIRSVSGTTDPSAAYDALMDRERRLREECAKRSEGILDAAWEAVGIVSADLSDAAAQVLSEHYLFGYTWEEVADSIGRRSRTTPKDMANAALDWLDSYCRVDEDADGPHVGIRR